MKDDRDESVENTIYLTEQSIKELLGGLPIYNDDDTKIIPPKTNELGLKFSYNL